jgi:uncharacterized glyoxalase superfamily protein PhnB
MVSNRSAPPGTIVPSLCYADTAAAIEWLCRVFGFIEDVRWGPPEMPSAQLSIGDGAVMVFGPSEPEENGRRFRAPDGDGLSHSVMVAVSDVDAHYQHAVDSGALVARELQTWPLIGERQYSVLDVEGHSWTFTQSVDDVDPRVWASQVRDTTAPHRD